MSIDHEGMPKAEFAFPGPLRDQLVAAVLDGTKTSTSSLLQGYGDDDPVPEVGLRSVLVDSDDRPVAVLEVTEVCVTPLGDVDLAHALDEGEGFGTVAQWRAVHEAFWHGPAVRAELGDPDFTVTDATPIVLERFRVVQR